MKQYIELGLKILNDGNNRNDRTLTGTRSVFGYQTRFDLQQGFPLLTTKKMFTKGIIHELLWFLQGSTNNELLVENNVHIWDEWALTEDHTAQQLYQLWDRCSMLAEKLKINVQEAGNLLSEKDAAHEKGFPHGGLAYLDEEGIPKDYPVIIQTKGALGPIYGKQWTSWRNWNGTTINQIQELINGLKNKPFSRRHVVSTWNPADLPDESISPQDNVKIGKMALAPCHCLFQFYVREMSVEERMIISGIDKNEWLGIPDHLIKQMNESNTPKYKLDCQLYQRSADTALGVPYNIASYALLTMMIAQCVGMVPGEFIHTFGDLHLYKNHIEKFEEQMDREPMALPVMMINPEVKDIFGFKFEDFMLMNYVSHEKIDYEISI